MQSSMARNIGRVFLLLALFILQFETAVQAQYTILYNDAGGNPLLTEDVNTCQSFDEVNSARLIIVSDGADNTSVTLTMPTGVSYVDGSVMLVSESGGLNIVQTTFDPINPVFSITPADLNSGDEITFSWAREADCDAVDYLMSGGTFKDVVEVSGDAGSITENNVNLNTYDVLVPSLSMFGEGPITANVGTSVMRGLTITNGGQGRLSEFTFYIIDGPGTTTTQLETSAGTVLTPSSVIDDTLIYTIDGPIIDDFGNLDTDFDNGEQVILTRTYTVDNCDNDSYYGSYWGCPGICMETDILLQTTVIPNLVPNLSFGFKDEVNNDFCFNGDNAAKDGTPVMQTFEMCNTGDGPATNIVLELHNNTPGSGTGQNYFTLEQINVFDENNVQIGTSSNQINVSAIPEYYQNDCTLERYPQNVEYEFDGIVVQPGECITLEVPTYANNLEEGCRGRCNGDIAWYYFNRSYSYMDQCEINSYDLSRAGIGFGGRQLARFDLEMPTDLRDCDTFNLEINYSTLHTQTKSDTEGFSRLIINLDQSGLTYIGPPTYFYSGSNDSALLPVNTVGDSVIIEYPNTVLGSGIVNLLMKATCDVGGGALTLDLAHQGKYDDSCAELPYHHNCLSRTFQMHCPDPCPRGGATPRFFSLERVSIGLEDDDNNGVPDGTGLANRDSIRLHRASNCDTVRGAWEIYVNPNTIGPNAGLPFNHVYIEFDLNHRDVTCNDQQIDNSFTPLPDAEVTVFPADGSPSYTCQVTASIEGADLDLAKYDLTPCKASWEGGDSIYVEALFRVNARTGSSGFVQYVADNEVYSSYIPDPVGPNPSDENKYTCDHYDDYLNIYHHYSSLWYPSPQVLNGCSGTIRMDYRYYINTQTGDIWYPNEYRPFTFPDEFRVNWPEELPYRPGSATFAGMAIPVGDISQIGDELVFSNLRQFFQSYGGTLLEPDETWSYSISFAVDATCDLQAGIYNSSYSATQIGNGCHSSDQPFPGWSGCGGTNSSNTAQIFYNTPQPFLTGGGMVQYSTNEVCWDVILNNGSNTVDAPFSWFYPDDLVGNLSNIRVLENGIPVNENNGFFELGTNAFGSSTSYEICAIPTTCDSAKVDLFTGYGCAEYPTTFNGLACESDTLIGIPHRSEVQLQVNSEPNIPLPLCSEQDVELQVTSAQAAYLDNPELTILLPTGTLITSDITYEYPAGSGNIEVAGFSQSGSLYTVDLEGHSLVSSIGIPGTLDALAPEDREVVVRFSVNTDCDFTSGSGIVFQAFGDRPCGDPAINNGVRARTSDLSVLGADLPFASSIDAELATDPKLIGCIGTEVLVNLEFVGLSSNQTTDEDSVFVTLDPGVEYVGDSFVCCSTDPGTCLSISDVQLLGSGQTKISLAMPAGGLDITNPVSSCFTINIKNSSNAECDVLRALTVEAVGSITGVQCSTAPGGECPSLKIITGQESIEFDTEKTELNLIDSEISCTSISNQVDFNLEIQLDSMGLLAGNEIIVDVYCADGNGMTAAYLNSEAISGPVAAGTQVQIMGMIDGNLCDLDNGIIVEISAVSNSGNDNCICEEIVIPSGAIECPECPDPNCLGVNVLIVTD